MLHRATPERLSAFSDGVFAVLITVLVLELRPPEIPTFKALLELWPTWLSYAVSYLFIAIVWVNHHYLMRYATTHAYCGQLRASVFNVAAPALNRLDGDQQVGAGAGCLLCGGLLPRQRDLHLFDP
ncbi:MAG: TMEM175 family protein [Pseudolabrys sp.]